ncbi:hypothetical protein F2P81_008571 [Scophthalmus maximus]|uniref:Uncharacterized protein n=1 Tax=Scophthalmus maximus TaxID=52904 RepID=A0A6A4SX04_SCOMX|nr:hypothetical protein F2P81_008571 [Scophthalmus maximus]
MKLWLSCSSDPHAANQMVTYRGGAAAVGTPSPSATSQPNGSICVFIKKWHQHTYPDGDTKSSRVVKGEEGPPSLEYIKAKDLFPQKELVKEDDSLQVPFPVLQGEGVEYLGRADEAIIAISNYRLHIKFKDSVINVPLRLIENVESRDMFQLHIICKDSKVVRLSPSYPQKLLVPIWITDKELESVASFRSWKRIPVVVYRHQKNGAVIARCSQPEISWWGWRNTDDEYLVTSIAKARQMDAGAKGACGAPACRQRGEAPDSSDSDFDSSLTGGSGCDDNTVPQKLLILDARSYTAAVANRAKGGGCECEEYYPNCEVMFMGMANIHAIRNSFQALRAVCSQIPDPGNWLSALESTRWLQHLSVMLKAATLVCSAVERDGRPVLVHCSDGWDRTPQIVALAKVLLDPYYRTLEGFQVLVETEWLDYGHKFGDRCGHQENTDDVSEQCPVFLQWLDCVHQLLKQFPCLFEFNEAFLVKLVQHTYSCLYGTFLCNNAREREARNIYKRTCSVWSLLRTGNKNFQNFLYIPSHDMGFQVLVETEWLDYGHKFGDRCGHQENTDDVSEQCPVFLQWLDCVHQLLKQFPCLFEFNEAFLVKLVQHTYSCLYGTFLCNNAREREARNIYKRTCSVWSLLRTGNKNFQNFLYIPSHDMVLQPVCHTRALQLWTAVYLPTSSPCTAVDDSMELYLPPSVTGDELTSRSLDRLPKTRSMDNLLTAFENGVPLTRTSSDPNLNKHCQEGRSALEPSPAVEEPSADSADEDVPDTGLDSAEEEEEPLHPSPAKTPNDAPGAESCDEDTLEEQPCLTTQPLPSLPLPPVPLRKQVTPVHTPFPTPVLQQALPQITNPPLPPPPTEAESPHWTAESTTSPTHKSEPCLPLPCNGTQPPASTPASLLNGHSDSQANGLSESVDLLTLKPLTPLLPMEDSTETLTDEAELPPALPPTVHHDLGENFTSEELPESQPQVHPQKEKEDMRTDVVKGRERMLTVAPVDCTQAAARHLISQSQLSDLSLLGSHWESVRGLVQSACNSASHSGISRALHPNTYQSRRLASKLLRSQGFAVANGSQCCRREAPYCPSSNPQPGWLSAAKSAGYIGLCGPAAAAAALNSFSLAGHQLLPLSYSPPSASSSPLPLQAPGYLDDDGLPVPMDAVQQRLRQIEAGYKQEVEVLRQQVRQLQMKLESKQYSTPPSEPDIDYEDDITCLRESDNSNEEDSLSTHSEDRLSEGSWDRVERRDMEVSVLQSPNVTLT